MITIGYVKDSITVVALVEKSKFGPIYRCQCDCGGVVSWLYSRITSSKGYLSCGCRHHAYKPEAKGTHPLYGIWYAMIHRCENLSSKAYPDYGGRGIKVCERWHLLENFLEDMGERPEGLTLERKDVNGDYEPDNCEWATTGEQGINKRNNLRVTYQGSSYTLSQLSRLFGVKGTKLYKLYHRVGSEEAFLQALGIP